MSSSVIGTLTLKPRTPLAAPKVYNLVHKTERGSLICNFGSDSSCDFRVNRPFVQNLHFSLEWRESRNKERILWLVNHAVSADTQIVPPRTLMLNGEDINFRPETTLSDGDTITLSERVFILNIWGHDQRKYEEYLARRNAPQIENPMLLQYQTHVSMLEARNETTKNKLDIANSEIKRLTRELEEVKSSKNQLEIRLRTIVSQDQIDQYVRRMHEIEHENDKFRELLKVERSEKTNLLKEVTNLRETVTILQQQKTGKLKLTQVDQDLVKSIDKKAAKQPHRSVAKAPSAKLLASFSESGEELTHKIIRKSKKEIVAETPKKLNGVAKNKKAGHSPQSDGHSDVSILSEESSQDAIEGYGTKKQKKVEDDAESKRALDIVISLFNDYEEISTAFLAKHLGGDWSALDVNNLLKNHTDRFIKDEHSGLWSLSQPELRIQLDPESEPESESESKPEPESDDDMIVNAEHDEMSECEEREESDEHEEEEAIWKNYKFDEVLSSLLPILHRAIHPTVDYNTFNQQMSTAGSSKSVKKAWLSLYQGPNPEKLYQRCLNEVSTNCFSRS